MEVISRADIFLKIKLLGSNVILDFWKDHSSQSVHIKDTKYISERIRRRFAKSNPSAIEDWFRSTGILDSGLSRNQKQKHSDLWFLTKEREWLLKKKRDGTNRGRRYRQVLFCDFFPVPFLGPVRKADVFILFDNPGFDLLNYEDEYQNPKAKEFLMDNLRGESPILSDSLIPSGWDTYWRRKINTIASEVVRRASSLGQKLAIDRARATVLDHIAVIQSCPYHSHRDPRITREKLESSRIARSFFQRELIPRVLNESVLVFVWKKPSFWGSGNSDYKWIGARNAYVHQNGKELSPEKKPDHFLVRPPYAKGSTPQPIHRSIMAEARKIAKFLVGGTILS